MDPILKIASNISTPLALGGLIAAITFLIFRQILQKNIFPKLHSDASARIIGQIITYLFFLSLVAMILGFIGYLAKPFFDRLSPTATLEEQLHSEAIRLSSNDEPTRLLALASLAKLEITQQDDFEALLRILADHISKLAPRTSTPIPVGTRSELETTFRALSNIIKKASTEKIKISNLSLTQLDLSGINLNGLYLAGIIITDSLLSDTNLSNSNLSGAKLTGVLAHRINAQNANLANTHFLQFCGEDANFYLSNMRNAVITSSDLNNAIFKHANLEATRFDNSRLTSATFDGANLATTDLTGALELQKNQIKEALEWQMNTTIPNYSASKISICRVRR